jgi:glutaredoxin-like protein NrdH
MTNPKTTVLSTPNCVQCKATERRLVQMGATYDYLDGTAPENAELVERIRAHHNGATQAPFVIVNGNLEKSWTGYRPDLLDLYSAPGAVAA